MTQESIIDISGLRIGAQQSLLIETKPTESRGIAVTEEISRLLSKDCVVAVGVSGGKDSVACALAVDHYLKQIGHTGPKVLIHADLGRVEWADSAPSCLRLAEKIGWELITARRQAGDLLHRWQTRWLNNVQRYEQLLCVRLILPWSTPRMRFCTSELKVAVICSELKKRYRGKDIINVVGIRREESVARRKMPVSADFGKLQTASNHAMEWHPIIEWSKEQVIHSILSEGLPLHEAYTRYNSTRVSCAFCILGSMNDLKAAASCADNAGLYRELVELEIKSTFGFQGNRWLGDIAPTLLDAETRNRFLDSKQKAQERQAIESEIPEHLLYTKGWPTSIPTNSEAQLLAGVRRRVNSLLNLKSSYLTATDVQERYHQLLRLKSDRKVANV
jgi:3'-phosphoadenosine 5'-phosphosulfate sulfotransferase (PAPS reductase)/FAD synthetase